ncbi:hypothetical protein AO976_06035 [Pseudomonas aeruginosa]|uniref:hypothetical protein n=1 Tax=Pseudomonas aeruginosa TaxID=287 RepID=UPI00071B9A6D|nr:hypothetical protein AO976_06035 [Pseudomonas aeruginosa]
MIKSLKFSHKILLAAALVVIATFSLFTLYNDSLQRASIREDLEDYLTLNQEGVENLQATLRACGELETQAGRLRQLVDSFKI